MKIRIETAPLICLKPINFTESKHALASPTKTNRTKQRNTEYPQTFTNNQLSYYSQYFLSVKNYHEKYSPKTASNISVIRSLFKQTERVNIERRLEWSLYLNMFNVRLEKGIFDRKTSFQRGTGSHPYG